MPRRRYKSDDLQWAAMAFIGVFVAVVVILHPGEAREAMRSMEPRAERVAAMFEPPPDQHFRGCDQARSAGRSNIPSSDPSYREFMDGDGDGLACEPYR